MASGEDLDALLGAHIKGQQWADTRQLLGHIATIFERQSCGRWSRKTAERKARAFYVALVKRLEWVLEHQFNVLELSEYLTVRGVHTPAWRRYVYPTQERRVKNGFGPDWIIPARPGYYENVPGTRELFVVWSDSWKREHYGKEGPRESPADENYPPAPFVRQDPEAGRLK